MKRLVMFSLALVVMLGGLSGYGQINKNVPSQKVAITKVEIYYFHFTRRCVTCVALEKNTKLAVESLYGDKVKSSAYSFKGVNLDEAGSKALAKQLKVGGQALLVVSGGKRVDITGPAYLNAENLEKLKGEIKKAVAKVLVK
jgi:hypothetical protein